MSVLSISVRPPLGRSVLRLICLGRIKMRSERNVDSILLLTHHRQREMEDNSFCICWFTLDKCRIITRLAPTGKKELLREITTQHRVPENLCIVVMPTRILWIVWSARIFFYDHQPTSTWTDTYIMYIFVRSEVSHPKGQEECSSFYKCQNETLHLPKGWPTCEAFLFQFPAGPLFSNLLFRTDIESNSQRRSKSKSKRTWWDE